ncbi:MAG TPA: NAD(P)H-hydrate epimerase [Chloroflexia bacterium]|nr:NAD(P)H-hydrate epimerase [Chloroflexia bacterium]
MENRIHTTNTLQPAVTSAALPAISQSQVRELFKLLAEEYGMPPAATLENIARACANLARRMLGGNLAGQNLTVLAGAGHCGASGLATARYLASAGANVAVILARQPEKFNPLAFQQQRLLARWGVSAYVQSSVPPSRLAETLHGSNLIIDALLAGGLQGNPNGAEGFLIQLLRQFQLPVLALDLPSGLPPDGEVISNLDLCVWAHTTLALALPRITHLQREAFEPIGNLYLANINVPPSLYVKLDLQVGPIFSAADLLLLRKVGTKERT